MTDIAGDATTEALIAIGETLLGDITLDDSDWVRLELLAGQAVTIDLADTSGTLDPFLQLRDADGAVVAENDDVANPADIDSQITYIAPRTGRYYIDAQAYRGNGQNSTGDYRLSVEAYTPLTGLDWGTQVSGTLVSVAFVPAGTEAGGYSSAGFNDYEIGRFMAAFASLSEVSALEFVVTEDVEAATFRLVADATGQLGFSILGMFQPPGEDDAGLGVFNVSAWTRTAGGSLEDGGAGFQTMVHELLHGLGLAHPHDHGGTADDPSAVFPGVTRDFGSPGDSLLNQGLFTTMSYNHGYLAGPVGTASSASEYGYERGPMALDIAALQAKYGANTNAHAGDDIYDLPGNPGAGAFYASVWDVSGEDTFRFIGTRDVTINLRPARLAEMEGGGGFVSAAEGVPGGFTIAAGVVIENALSGSGDDRLTGNPADNRLDSGAGRDVLQGGSGADLLRGGMGADMLRGGHGRDLLRGQSGDDVLVGGQGRDKLFSGKGDDVLTGGEGADVFVMRAGWGHDVVLDFTLGEDRLSLKPGLWEGTLGAAEVVALASVTPDGVLWDFGDAGEILLAGLGTTEGLDAALIL